MKRVHCAVLIALALLSFAELASAQPAIVLRTARPIADVLATPLIDGKITIVLPSGTQIIVPITDVEIGLTRSVNGAAVPIPSTTSATPGDIRAKCEEEWPSDFRMRVYCEQQQKEAQAALGRRVMTSPAQQTIRANCQNEWPRDYRMRNYCEEQQLKALQQLSR
jgi:hypothetical protein